MKTITIDKKEYKVADAVADEIVWLDIKLKSAKEIIKQVEDLDDDFDTERCKYESNRQRLLNEIRNL